MPRDSHDPVPAITRPITDDDRDAEVLGTPMDTVSFTRGFGDSGTRVETVEHDCPACNFDRMVRRVNISPEDWNRVRYWCLNPNCAHFVRDHLSHACHGNYPQRSVKEPAISGNEA